MKKNNITQGIKGFTIVEIVIVIVLIGILAAIMIPKFYGFTDKATASEALIQAKQAATAMDAYHEEHHDWPTNQQTSDISEVPLANIAVEDDGGVIIDTPAGFFAGRESASTAILADADLETAGMQY